MTTTVLALFAALALALVVHEAGHAFAAIALRLPWCPVLTWRGPGISIGSESLRLTRVQVVVTAAAGPLASLALATLAFRFGQPFLALVSLDLCVVNLLPMPHSDGTRMLRWPSREAVLFLDPNAVTEEAK